MPGGSLNRKPRIDFERFDFAATMAGTAVSAILSADVSGRVFAVFDSCFYIKVQDVLICVGGERLAAGPLNLITTAPQRTNWRASGVRVNQRISAFNQCLLVGERFRFDLAGCKWWSPDPLPLGWSTDDLERGLIAFRQACFGNMPGDGLGGIIHGDDGWGLGNALHERARGPVRSLDRWLAGAFREPDRMVMTYPGDLADLLGLGPGLTPSGDDFVGGMMIAARSLDEVALCRGLWGRVRPLAKAAGNLITFAHLTAASDGAGNIGIHDGIKVIFSGESVVPESVLEGIDAIGHTSGWDAMAGVTRVLDAWLRARGRKSTVAFSI
jgi:hypothetical protein